LAAETKSPVARTDLGVEGRYQNPPANGNPTRDEVQDTAFTDDGNMIVARFSDAANDGTPANEGKMPWD
jgi:hypothetical protein